jgi:hypothetical protein
MGINARPQEIETKLQRSIPYMNWAVSVYRPKGSYADEENGIKIAIFMDGIHRQVPLCWVEPGDNNPYD